MPRVAKKKPPKPAVVEQVEPAANGYAIGSRVSHPMFGDGAVTAVDGDKLTIKFKDGRVRLIVATFVKLR